MNLHVKDRKLIISVYLTLFFNQESNLKVKRKKRIKHLPQAFCDSNDWNVLKDLE